MNILISGSLAYDRIMDFPGRFEEHILPEKIHILNVCFTVNGLCERFGGTAGNIAYNLALLGERPTILAAAGRDFDRYAEWLERNGLTLTGIRRVPEELTAGAYITTDQADNQITGFNPGAMKYPAGHEITGIDPDGTIAIISPGNPEDMVAYSRRCKALGIRYICDPGQQIPILPPGRLTEMIDGCEVLISNDYELEMIVNATGIGEDRIRRLARAVITTLGEHGSVVKTGEREVRIPAVEAEKVADPTGAGDAYRSGLLKGICMGKALPAAAGMGATCASFAVEFLGTQEHRFTAEQFAERHARAFGAGV